MLYPNFAVYLGKEKENAFSGFVVENNLFLALEVEEGLTGEDGREALQKIKTEIYNSNIRSLADFEQFLNDNLKKINIPSSFSLAVGFLIDKVFYLKTVGQGKIFLRKGKDFAQIIDKENSASGYISYGDFFIFTTGKFVDLFGGELELRSIFDSKSPHQIVDELTPQLKSKDDYGAIALFVSFEEKVSEQADTEEKISDLPRENILNKPSLSSKNIFSSLRSYFHKLGRKKTIILVTVVIVSFILIWSVVFGLIKRTNSDAESKINNVRELVSLKLKQADDVAFLNLPRALALISETKDEVNKLKKELGNKNQNEIADIEKLISSEENKIVKREEKNYEEFYDLTLDNKNAKGDKFYLDGKILDILDKSKGVIYGLSLPNKSLDKKTASDAKSASLIGSYQDAALFFLSGQGIYKISSDNKTNKVIDNDKDWGNIKDLTIYNGNIYLLDSGKDQIYKYLTTDNGYSDKSLYFKTGSGISFKDANSIAIDSSVYIGFSDHVLKYTGAIPEDFNTTFPEKGVKLVKIFTSKDVEKVYGWDKAKGAIYILNKDGTYEREINSSILSKASDFVVYSNAAYILDKEKIYKISLE